MSDLEADEEYDVEDIMGSIARRGRVLYHVKWLGYARKKTGLMNRMRTSPSRLGTNSTTSMPGTPTRPGATGYRSRNQQEQQDRPCGPQDRIKDWLHKPQGRTQGKIAEAQRDRQPQVRMAGK